MLGFHNNSIQSTPECGIVDVLSMITKVGEYFRKEFNWELENCASLVRYRSKNRTGTRIPTSAGLNLLGPMDCNVGLAKLRRRHPFWQHQYRAHGTRKAWNWASANVEESVRVNPGMEVLADLEAPDGSVF